MLLPFLKSTNRATDKQVVAFRGINYSDKTADGDLRDSLNLSARRYPYLSTRRGREKQTAYSGCTALMAHGKLVAVRGTDLLYDGKAIGTVTEGEKQFAVVNTSLVVFPDKIVVDLEKHSIRQMEVELESTGAATFTTNSLSMPVEYASQKLTDKYYGTDIYVYTYSSVSFNSSTKKWTVVGKRKDKLEDFANVVGRYYIPDATYVAETDSFVNLKPATSFGGDPKEPKNNYGVYGKFSSYQCEYTDWGGARFAWYNDIIRTDKLNASFADAFRAGDVVSISGSLCGYYDKESVKIERVDASTNTLFFSENTFRAGDAIYQAAKDLSDEKKYFVYDDAETGKDKNFSAASKLSVKAGDILVIDGTNLHILDENFNVVKTVALTATDTYSTGNDRLRLTALSPQNAPVKVERKIPALDYICEHENRLWGVSNADKTIYSSALGDPTNFYVYDGLSTDSYAVAVGTEGEFTGCCKLSSSLLFWKESKLHKLLGSYPAEYRLYTYDIEGLQKGCHKSLQVINETLYYMGMHGVYAYNGGLPSLLSSNFGDKRFTNAVAGNDGDSYYLSAHDGEKQHLFVFETQSGLWVREDDTQVVDFARIGKDLYLLDSGGDVWLADSRMDDTEMDWVAQFTPFYETIHGRKMYSRLLLRMELPEGAWMRAEVCFGDGKWREVGKLLGRKQDSIPLLVPINRCDRFELRLSGCGPCTILAMMLEYQIGSEV